MHSNNGIKPTPASAAAHALAGSRVWVPMRLIPVVHLASLREPGLEEFPVGGVTNKLKVRLRV